MTAITTTTGLIRTLSTIKSKKLEYQSLLTKYEEELANSELMKKIQKWKDMIKDLEKQEIETRKKWISILQDAGIDKFSANWVEVRLKTSIWKLVVDDENLVPNKYKKEVIKTTIQKKEIKEDIKQWLKIDWVRIEKETTLEIKFS